MSTFSPGINFYTSYVEALFRFRKYMEAFDLVFGPNGLSQSDFTPDGKFVTTFITCCQWDPVRLLKMFREKWPDAINYKHSSLENYKRKWKQNINLNNF